MSEADPIFQHQPDEYGLVYAWALDGRGSAEPLRWEDLAERGGRPRWVHLDAKAEAAQAWLGSTAGVPAWVARSLGHGSNRPRAVSVHDDTGVVLTFRGVNFNPGSTPDDMIVLNAYADEGRVITCRSHRMRAAVDLRKALEAGRGPARAAEVLLFLAGNMTERTGEVIGGLESQLQEIAAELERRSGDLATAARRLSSVRRQIAGLRRYLGPQREALQRLSNMSLSFVTDADRVRFREIGERAQLRVEDLDALREEAAVLDDEIKSTLAERQNGRLFVLAVLSAVFLPLGLITGVFGMNVGGLPFMDTSAGFWILFVAMLMIAGGILLDLRLRGWF